MKKMKKIFVTTLMLFAFTTAATTQDSHALIGLAFKSKPVKVIGAIGSGAGVLVSAYGYGVAITTASFVGVIAGAVILAYGVIILGIGLVVLDGKNIADIEFKSIDVNQPAAYAGFTREQVEHYNSELAQLNMIRQTMIAESNDEADTADAEVLWKKYSTYLHTDTVQIAEKQAAEFLKAIGNK